MENKTDWSEPTAESGIDASGSSNRNLINLYPEMYLITDWDGRIVEVNIAAEKISGFNQRQVFTCRCHAPQGSRETL